MSRAQDEPRYGWCEDCETVVPREEFGARRKRQRPGAPTVQSLFNLRRVVGDLTAAEALERLRAHRGSLSAASR